MYFFLIAFLSLPCLGYELHFAVNAGPQSGDNLGLFTLTLTIELGTHSLAFSLLATDPSVIAHHHPSLGFPGGSAGKESACNPGDLGLIPGLRNHMEKEKATHFSILAWRIPWTV